MSSGFKISFRKSADNFFLRLLVISACLLLLWKPVSLVYVHLVTTISNIIYSIFSYKPALIVVGGITKISYPQIGEEQLVFSINDIDQIFLNIIVFTALTASSNRAPLDFRLKLALKGGAILLIAHIIVLYLYSYVTIWEHIYTQPDAVKI